MNPIIAILCAAVGGLVVHALHQRTYIARLEGDLDDLWDEVFGAEEDDPDPADEAEPEVGANVVMLKGRAA